jgi:hypothetical protein
MLDYQGPQSEVALRQTEEFTNALLTPVATTREGTEGLLAAPQLPAEFINRIKLTKMISLSGEDLKGTLLDYCEEINETLAKIHRIPELSEAVRGITEKLKNNTGETLYAQISDILEEMNRLTQVVTDKATNLKSGSDYIQNTEDGPGTPRVDLEAALLILQKTRPLYNEVNKLGLASHIQERDQEVQNRMDYNGNTQFVVRYKMLRDLEDEITGALERGEINDATSHLILKATSGQMNMAFNVVGQRGAPFYQRIDEDDLGANDAERQLTILDIYWHLLGTAEGFKFIQKFFERGALSQTREG